MRDANVTAHVKRSPDLRSSMGSGMPKFTNGMLLPDVDGVVPRSIVSPCPSCPTLLRPCEAEAEAVRQSQLGAELWIESAQSQGLAGGEISSPNAPRT